MQQPRAGRARPAPAARGHGDRRATRSAATPRSSTSAASTCGRRSCCSARSTRPTRRVPGPGDRSGSDFDLDVVLHRGAGAYICGEETALLNSLEGFRGQPRLRPPFPAVEGLYECPTVINNVETLMNVPAHRRATGPIGSRRSAPRSRPARSCSRSPARSSGPGNYELPMGTPLRVLLEEHAGGVSTAGAEGVDPGRLLDAVPHRRAPGRRPGLRVGRWRRGRCSAPAR